MRVFAFCSHALGFFLQKAVPICSPYIFSWRWWDVKNFDLQKVYVRYVFTFSQQIAFYDEWKQGENPLSRLCHTCRLVRPLRAKHCRVMNRCVKHFDHYCPYIYNDVGYRNRYVCEIGLEFSIYDVIYMMT